MDSITYLLYHCNPGAFQSYLPAKTTKTLTFFKYLAHKHTARDNHSQALKACSLIPAAFHTDKGCTKNLGPGTHSQLKNGHPQPSPSCLDFIFHSLFRCLASLLPYPYLTPSFFQMASPPRRTLGFLFSSFLGDHIPHDVC